MKLRFLSGLFPGVDFAAIDEDDSLDDIAQVEAAATPDAPGAAVVMVAAVAASYRIRREALLSNTSCSRNMQDAIGCLMPLSSKGVAVQVANKGVQGWLAS